MKRHDLLTRLLLNGNWVSFNIYNNLWGRSYYSVHLGEGETKAFSSFGIHLSQVTWASVVYPDPRPGHFTCISTLFVSLVKQFFDLLFGFLLSFKLIRLWTCRTGCCLVAKSCLFCNPMDCSPPGSSLHGISQARILEYVAMMYSRGSYRPRDQTFISCVSRQIFFFTTSATWEAPVGLEQETNLSHQATYGLIPSSKNK